MFPPEGVSTTPCPIHEVDMNTKPTYRVSQVIGASGEAGGLVMGRVEPARGTPAGAALAVADASSALLSDTDLARIYRRVTGASRFDESALMLMREVEHAVNEHRALAAPAVDAREQFYETQPDGSVLPVDPSEMPWREAAPAPAGVAPLPAEQQGEREAFVTWLSTTYPTSYSVEDAEHCWRHNHVAVLAWQARAALASRAAPQADSCPDCHGSGEGEAIEGRGPDTYTVTISCPRCNGTGVAPQTSGDEASLSTYEQRAVLADLMGLECLINYHGCKQVEADAIEPGAGSFHEKRALALLAIGRKIIDEDPDIWSEAEKKPFDLRHSERAALKAAQSGERGERE